MKFWIKKTLVFIWAGGLYLLGQYFRGAWWPFFTWPYQCYLIISGPIHYCEPVFMETRGFPLIAAGEIFAIVAIILVFANRYAFKRWLILSAWYVPIAFLILLQHPQPQPGLDLINGTTSEHLTWLIGYLYIAFTFLLVLYWRLKPVPKAS